MTTVLVYVSRDVVVFEIFGGQVGPESEVTRLQNAVPDDECQPTFSTTGLAVNLCHAEAAVAAIAQAGFQLRWTGASDRIQ
jgi:hypothetical protein